MTNSSLITADRTTHLKIVVVSLLASIAVMAIGIAARPQPPAGAQAVVYKAEPPVMATSDAHESVR